jgi:hypothetical protein
LREVTEKKRNAKKKKSNEHTPKGKKENRHTDQRSVVVPPLFEKPCQERGGG